MPKFLKFYFRSVLNSETQGKNYRTLAFVILCLMNRKICKTLCKHSSSIDLNPGAWDIARYTSLLSKSKGGAVDG